MGILDFHRPVQETLNGSWDGGNTCADLSFCLPSDHLESALMQLGFRGSFGEFYILRQSRNEDIFRFAEYITCIFSFKVLNFLI